MKAEEGYQKLKENYPNCIKPGVILGDTKGIVAQFGLELIFVSAKDYTKKRFFFEENYLIPITEFHENYLLINIETIGNVKISYEKFKGFVFENKIFI